MIVAGLAIGMPSLISRNAAGNYGQLNNDGKKSFFS